MWGSDTKSGKNVTLITAKAEIQGDVLISDALHIEGVIKGNILADPDSKADVTVGVKGIVVGEIRAPNVTISGEIRGNVYSSELLTLNKMAKVFGDVHYAKMEVVIGAQINGKMLYVSGASESSPLSVETVESDDVSMSTAK